MKIFFKRSLFIAAPPVEVFEKAVMDIAFLEKSVEQFGPLPKVVATEVIGFPSLQVGAIRRVTLSSGGVLNEFIESIEFGPEVYSLSYRQLTGFPFPLSLISKTAEGQYIAEPSRGGTLFSWQSTHSLRFSICLPVAQLLRKMFVHPMMFRFLKNSEAILTKKI